VAANTNIQIPFVPQTGVTEQILAAIQSANELHARNQQFALQSQQNQIAQAGLPSEIALRDAQTARFNAQTELDRANLGMRRDLIGSLIGTGDAQPEQLSPSTPLTAPVRAQQTNTAIAPASNPAPSREDFETPGEYLLAVKNYQQGQAKPQAPVSTAKPANAGGLIGRTVGSLLEDPSLTPAERNSIQLAGLQSKLKVFGTEPEKALDGVIESYNSILKQKGEAARSIKLETVPDSQSSTGYSTVATTADGKEAYRHPATAPIPKDLQEASSYLGSAALNYQRDPTPGNKTALTLAQTQHDLMYKDKVAEAAQQAKQTAVAQGKDYEAMVRTGKNPISGETLNVNNAPPSALVNPSSGQVIPQDMVTLYKPTINERQTADTARQVLAISQTLRDTTAKNPELIGPLAGRSQEALQKLGISSHDAAKLIDDVTFLQSAATKMHTGRFSSEILQKMGSIIKPGMGLDEFRGSLDSIDEVANRYANEDKLTTVFEYQQRQQFESQAAARASVAPAVAAKHGFQ
jgi:hypothetical protein